MVNGETCKKNPQSATSIFRKLLTCHWHHDPITFDLSLPSDCLIAEARCVWCTYVLLLLDSLAMESRSSKSNQVNFSWLSLSLFHGKGGDCIGTISCWISPMFELQAWFVAGVIMCHSEFLLMFSKSGPCNHHNIITIGKSQAFLRWTLVVLPYSSAHLLPHVGGNPVSLSNPHVFLVKSPICLLGNSTFLLLKSPFPKNSWMCFIQIVNWNINPTILADSITISQPPTGLTFRRPRSARSVRKRWSSGRRRRCRAIRPGDRARKGRIHGLPSGNLT